MVDLSIGTTPFVYTGGAVERTVTADGTITVDLWGGAGGGGYFSGTGGPGGSGGYTRIVLNVFAGDVVKIETAQGGRKSPGPASNGGVGGWPDGGSGGAYAPLASTIGPSGGGGSSRVYINNVLVAVAGGGGGGLIGGGAGGGTNGLDAPAQASVDNSNSRGTSTQGGYRMSFSNYGSTPALIRGSFLQGGHGWGSNSGDQNTNNSTPSEYTGCGGGGGYYGGAGGRAGERQFPSGGGGSGYIASALGYFVSGSTTAGSGGTPYDGVNTDRPSGIGVGGSTSATPTDGGDGYVRMVYAAADAPGNASGLLATVTVTPPQADSGGAATGTGSVGTITSTAPEASATGDALASGEIGLVGVIPPNAEPTSSALIIVPINDDVEIVLTAPEAGAEGGFTPIEVPLPTVLAYAPEAEAGVSIDISGEIGTITAIPPEGIATPGMVGTGDIGTVTVTPPEADATGAAVAIAQTFGEGDNRVIALVLLGDSRAPQAYVTAEGEAFAEALPDVVVSPPEATAEEGVSGVGEAFPDITVTPPEAVATSGVNVIPPTEGSFDGPFGVYLKLVTTSPPAATATGEVDISGALPQVRLTPPAPTLLMGASVVVAMARRVEVRPPQGMIIFEGEALASGDFGTVEVTPPEALVLIDDSSEDVEAIGDIPLITVTAPTAIVSFAGDVVVPLPTVYLSPPEAYVEVLDDEGNLPPTFAPLRFKRTLVPGRAPNSLQDREIALNEADGVLYSRDSGGQVVETDYLMLAEGGFVPEGGSEGQVLSDSGAWVDPEVVYDAPIRVPDASGTRIALVEGVTGAQNISTTAGRVYYRPFFVPRALQITDLGIQVVTTGSGIAHLGICGWSLSGQPGETLLVGQVSTAIAGLRVIAGEVTLPAGWYAAMFAFTGVGTPTFRAARASPSLDEDFLPVGDPSADFSGDLDPPPAPEQFEPAALGYLSAECA